MHYTLHQLRIFQKICEHQSVTKAADELYLTQPAVSIQLKRLQEQFEIPLTEVMGRRLFITEFGRQISKVSDRILLEADSIKSTIDSYKGLLTGEIKVSVVSTGKYVIPYFLNGFAKKYPQLDIIIDVTNKARVVDSLLFNETDFALVSVLPENIPLETIRLMENVLYLVGKRDYSKGTKKVLKPSDLSKLPMIYREKGSATRKAMEDYMQSHNVQPKQTLELVSNEAVKQAVNADMGYSIMPLIGLRNELQYEDLCIIPSKGLPIVTNWNLVYNKGKRLSPASQAFVNYINENKEEITETHFSWTKKFK